MTNTESLCTDRLAGDHDGSYGDVTSSIAGYGFLRTYFIQSTVAMHL